MNSTIDPVTLVTSWLTDVTSNISNTTDLPLNTDHVCLQILYETIGQSQVGIWDLMILVPNVLFLFYLLFKSCYAVAVLGRSSSPIFMIIFALIFTAVCMGIVRCIVSMSISSITTMNIVDRIMWLILKFFLLATELSVVTFGLLLVHLDSRTSVRKVVLVAFSFSLVYSTCQGVLEFKYENETFRNDTYNLFGHGGLIFWFASFFVLFLIYSVICCLPYTRLAYHLILPTRRSFYFYCFMLAILDITQAVGSVVLHYGHKNALCVVDVTAYLYFTFFAPFVYIIFIRTFFQSSPTTLLFSYRRQDEEDVSLPRQLPYDHPDSGSPLENVTDMLDSTHFSCGSPLFAGLGSRPELSINPDVYNTASTGNIQKSHALLV